MSGWRRSVCDCCPVTEQCGINNVSSGFYDTASWCSAPTESACPATYTIAFTIPTFNYYLCCGDDPAILHIARPEISCEFTISQLSFNNCVYTGSSTTVVDIDANGCDGQEGTMTSRQVSASISSGEHVGSIHTGPYVVRTPCGSAGSDSPESAGKCCGIVVTVIDQISGYYHGNFTNLRQGWSNAYKTSTIDNCSTECPCIGHYVSGQGHFQNTFDAVDCEEQSLPSHFGITIS